MGQKRFCSWWVGRMIPDTKSMRVLLRLFQAQSEFKNTQVLWKPSKRGPRMRVQSRGKGAAPVVEINYKGLSIPEVESLVCTALKFANDMVRELTSASQVASEATGEIHVGIRWADTERGKVEVIMRQQLELFR
jgi:hypothetical protein